MNHLKILEAEAIDLIRDVVFSNDIERQIVFYSIGKDSSCLLHLFKKAFHPFPIPVKFMHIDTGWKFKEMYEFRNKIQKEIELIVYKNPKNLNPFTDGPLYTDVMKTEALKQAINLYDIKIAFGGSRRDEEKSRAKERMVSVRNEYHKWDPRNQNPEISPLYNTFFTPKTSLRVFPLSNWTELDIWEYIKQEEIDIVPLYFAKKRRVQTLPSGMMIATENETGELKKVRFRTLGCYPLTGAVLSDATTIDAIIAELKQTQYTERITRIIDYDTEGSMEKKKKDGYF
ncbi:MAG: sulfate adenylyltransferase subunit 2 [Alphaproteobacteria bacterium]|nr:sulfate adenylyltransferase subunit 2 [Alphaproteobacteria bacterium]